MGKCAATRKGAELVEKGRSLGVGGAFGKEVERRSRRSLEKGGTGLS